MRGEVRAGGGAGRGAAAAEAARARGGPVTEAWGGMAGAERASPCLMVVASCGEPPG